MEKITVDEWGGLELYFDPDEVKNTTTPGEILEALKDAKGRRPYSPMRCAAFAETPEGKKTIEEIRRICEGGGDKKKVQRGVRKAPIDGD